MKLELRLLRLLYSDVALHNSRYPVPVYYCNIYFYVEIENR